MKATMTLKKSRQPKRLWKVGDVIEGTFRVTAIGVNGQPMLELLKTYKSSKT